ncbi:MAG: cytochrome c3 family protein [Deltaproteobacteria bacterium]|jgi:hypothetical protein|nr:cytochrome c3 family protein [Deltaproteobacteria bacterium]
MKKIFVIGLMLLISAFAMTAIAAQPTAPADGIKMERTKKPLVFNHSKHVWAGCAVCHHPIDGQENYVACATAGCHDVLGIKDKSINSYYQIAHKAKGAKYYTCISCHIANARDDKELQKQLAGCAKSACHS